MKLRTRILVTGFIAWVSHLIKTDALGLKIPKSFVILSNLQSGKNIGTICRNCLSFNVKEVVVVGRSSYVGKMRNADRGAKANLNFKNFPSTDDAETYLRSLGVEIIGVEIMDSAIPIMEMSYNRDTAFVFGNEGTGLSERQRRMCDRFVYIPQYSNAMASINVACASAIVLQHFAYNVGMTPEKIVGEKFSEVGSSQPSLEIDTGIYEM